MKFISFLLAISLLFTVSVKANTWQASTTKQDQHALKVESLNELLAYMWTGTFEHSHEHQDEQNEREHAHPHRHTLASSHTFDDFISTEFSIHLQFTMKSWPPNSSATMSGAFSSQIFRPPIWLS